MLFIDEIMIASANVRRQACVKAGGVHAYGNGTM